MRTRRLPRPLAALVLALAATVGVSIVPAAVGPAIPPLAAIAPPVARAADNIDVGTTTRYVIVPSKALIRVIVDIVAVNQHPDQTTGGVTTRYFYDGVNLGVQPEATKLRATQNGSRVAVTSAKRTGYRLVTVKFLGNLYYGQTARVRLRFVLPAGKPRSASDVRVGAAFASFLAWAFGDHGLVRVEVPPAFDANVTGSTMSVAYDPDGTEVLTAATSSALDWYAWIDARNDSGLTHQQLNLADGEHLIIRAWPEDKRWRRRVASVLREGVPDLARRIGLPWPVDGPLSVLEIHTPLLEGYAGFYDTAHSEITISEELDDLTIVHEASHAWFNDGLFTQRWINEGLADEYASRVLVDSGHKAVSPRPVKPTAKVAFPLDSWPPPAPISNSESDAKEQYGYDASWTVVRAVVTSAGEAGMRRVFRAAADGTTAYVGAGAPEKSRLPNDWRRFLDLTEELGGATGVAQLMATWVVPPGEQSTLAARAKARDDYHALVAADGTWAAPTVVRMAMDGWTFDAAEGRIADAESIVAERDTMRSLAASLGLTPPNGLERAYEQADSQAALQSAADLAATTEASLESVSTASQAAAAPRDWLVSLGLVGKDPDGMLTAARTSWEAGDLAAATASATLVTGTLAVAAEAGRGRAIVIAGGVALLILLLALLLIAYRERRRMRARRAAALAAATAASTPASGQGASWDEPMTGHGAPLTGPPKPSVPPVPPTGPPGQPPADAPEPGPPPPPRWPPPGS